LLSDHVFHFFGRTITITGREEFLAIMVLVVAATAWAVQQFRRRRAVVLQRSTVSDQLVYELTRLPMRSTASQIAQWTRTLPPQVGKETNQRAGEFRSPCSGDSSHSSYRLKLLPERRAQGQGCSPAGEFPAKGVIWGLC